MRIILTFSILISFFIFSCQKEANCSKSIPVSVSKPLKEDWRKGKLPVHWIWKAKYIDNFLSDTLVDYMGKNKKGC